MLRFKFLRKTIIKLKARQSIHTTNANYKIKQQHPILHSYRYPVSPVGIFCNKNSFYRDLCVGPSAAPQSFRLQHIIYNTPTADWLDGWILNHKAVFISYNSRGLMLKERRNIKFYYHRKKRMQSCFSANLLEGKILSHCGMWRFTCLVSIDSFVDVCEFDSSLLLPTS